MGSGYPAEYNLDFYSILEIKPSASHEDIRQAYKRLALKWHPDKNQGNNATQEKFKQIKGAYEVLSDAAKKKQYDSLRGTWSGTPEASTSSGRGYPWSRDYRSRQQQNDYQGYRNFFHEQVKPPGPDHFHCFHCTLEEIYTGVNKRMKVRRQVLDEQQRPRHVEEVVTFAVPPGAYDGARFKFPGLADEEPGYSPGTLIFVLRVRTHERFVREGDDLIVVVEVSVADAICGARISVPHLDGSNVRLRLKELELLRQPPAEDGSRAVDVVKLGRGMPAGSSQHSRYGQLVVRLRLATARLTEDQRLSLRKELEEASARQHNFWLQVGFGVAGSVLLLSLLKGGRPLRLLGRVVRGVAWTCIRLLLL